MRVGQAVFFADVQERSQGSAAFGLQVHADDGGIDLADLFFAFLFAIGNGYLAATQLGDKFAFLFIQIAGQFGPFAIAVGVKTYCLP